MAKQVFSQEDSKVRVNDGALRDTVKSIFERVGVPPEDADIGADVLVRADLMGVESHGVSNMLERYVVRYKSGVMNPRPKWRIIRETPGTATIDADQGLGVIIMPQAMEIAIAKAKKVGVGMVTVGNSRHLGMAVYHAMVALKHDMIGVCMSSVRPTVLPSLGSEVRLGTNPIAVAAPAGEEPPFVFDAATSVVPDNKVDIVRRLGGNLFPGWIGDEHGTPIMESVPAPPRDGYQLLPLGSIPQTGAHKGYGLACVVDILCGGLSGSGYGAVRDTDTVAHSVTAYNIDAFLDVTRFKSMMDEWLRTLKETPPAPGNERVLVAGQMEWEAEQDRSANGIPLHKEVVQWFRDTCAEMEIPYILG
ncbi:MAG: Ldh family oxidoreductase [Chloroflexi bacterium]|nr:Ldh family oxidoreductase [Chloroflexota bacterium]